MMYSNEVKFLRKYRMPGKKLDSECMHAKAIKVIIVMYLDALNHHAA
jgi:hypothetical protein